MGSHSERQIQMLARMGVDVWKSRYADPPPDEGQVETTDAAEVGTLDPSSRVTADTPPPIAQNSTSITSAGATAESLRKEIEPAETSTPAVNWRALVEGPDSADWLFVFAVTAGNEEAEEKLFGNILHALGLDKDICGQIKALPLSEGQDCDDGERIAAAMSAVIERSAPLNIVLFGESLAHFLIGTDKSLDQLRAESYRYQGGNSRLVVTYGLDHMLANPLDKSLVWQDLLKAKSAIS